MAADAPLANMGGPVSGFGPEADAPVDASPARLWTVWLVQAVMFWATREIYRRYMREPSVVPPRSTWLLWLLNVLLTVPCWLVDCPLKYKVPKIGYMLERPLSLAKLRRVAEQRTGLSDWGESPTFPALFERSIKRLNEVRPTPFGRLVTFDYLMRRLITRLEVVDAAKRLSDTTTAPVVVVKAAPLFVMGLPRTGTTLLHRLLALDPAARFPKTYELLDPVNRKNYSHARRAAYVDRKLDLIKRVVPHVEAIHELGAEEAEECLLGLGVDVPMLPPTFRHLVREVVEELVGNDADDASAFPDIGPAYELYKTQLRIMAAAAAAASEEEEDSGSSQEKQKRWCLKCPAHVPFVGDLLRAFPDARIVWTHRDPRESLPSLGSMFRTFADMCEADDIDLQAIGREQLEFWSAAVRRADARLAGVPRDRVAHVKFADTVDDPVGVVERIYAHFGWTVSAEFGARMRDYIEANKATRKKIPRHLKRYHKYTLHEYGLTRDAVRTAFAAYYRAHLDDD